MSDENYTERFWTQVLGVFPARSRLGCSPRKAQLFPFSGGKLLYIHYVYLK